MRGREEILRVHTRKIPLAEDVDLSVLARGTPGFSGADLANMVNEAALAAARQNRKAVLQYDFELAKDKVLMGVERKSLLLTDAEKKNTAYHEAGHALVAAKCRTPILCTRSRLFLAEWRWASLCSCQTSIRDDQGKRSKRKGKWFVSGA